MDVHFLRRLFRHGEQTTEPELGPPDAAATTAEQQERLARLQELRDQGLLTNSEYAEQRHRILGS